jgi:hypothetical protein
MWLWDVFKREVIGAATIVDTDRFHFLLSSSSHSAALRFWIIPGWMEEPLFSSGAPPPTTFCSG